MAWIIVKAMLLKDLIDFAIGIALCALAFGAFIIAAAVQGRTKK